MSGPTKQFARFSEVGVHAPGLKKQVPAGWTADAHTQLSSNPETLHCAHEFWYEPAGRVSGGKPPQVGQVQFALQAWEPGQVRLPGGSHCSGGSTIEFPQEDAATCAQAS